MDYGFISNIGLWPWLLAGVIVYITLQLKRDRRISHLIEKFPGPPPLPVIGNALSLAVPNHELLPVLNGFVQKHGSIFRIWLLNRPYILCGSADVVEKLLSSNVHIDKSGEYGVLHNWLGTGLLTSAGQKWHSRRKMLTPTFHFKILEDFLDVFNEQSQVLVNVLRTDQGNGQTFDIFPYVTRCTLDVICETAMGKKVNVQKQQKELPYIQAIYGINEVLIQRMLRPWMRPDIIWKFSSQGRREKEYLKILHKFTLDVIAEKREQRKKVATNGSKSTVDSDLGTKKRVAFLDLLLDLSENGNGLSDVDIREEVDTFMFEGHDTTSASVNFTLFLIGCHPEIQQKVHDELDEIFGPDMTRAVTTADIAKMKFLECCIKESLRLYPSVPFITRTLKADLSVPTQSGVNLVAPAGTVTFIAPYLLHRDTKYFPDPEKFDPKRFLPENASGRHPYAYVPFSAGPRNCIGQKFALMEEKVIIADVLRNFNVESVDKQETLRLLPDVILRPMEGLYIKISERS